MEIWLCWRPNGVQVIRRYFLGARRRLRDEEVNVVDYISHMLIAKSDKCVNVYHANQAAGV